MSRRVPYFVQWIPSGEVAYRRRLRYPSIPEYHILYVPSVSCKTKGRRAYTESGAPGKPFGRTRVRVELKNQDPPRIDTAPAKVLSGGAPPASGDAAANEAGAMTSKRPREPAMIPIRFARTGVLRVSILPARQNRSA